MTTLIVVFYLLGGFSQQQPQVTKIEFTGKDHFVQCEEARKEAMSKDRGGKGLRVAAFCTTNK